MTEGDHTSNALENMYGQIVTNSNVGPDQEPSIDVLTNSTSQSLVQLAREHGLKPDGSPRRRITADHPLRSSLSTN